MTTLHTIFGIIFQLGMCSMQYVENAAATDSFQLHLKTATTALVRKKNKYVADQNENVLDIFNK